MAKGPSVFVGTSGWSYPDWKGAFYPQGTRPADFLAHYASRFSSVEVDGSYYRAPTREDCRRWASMTPEEFRFTPKMPKKIVHGGEPRERALSLDRVWNWDATGELAEAFLRALEELGPRLGPILLQCPRYPKKAYSSWEAFLDAVEAYLRRLPADIPFVLEIRNPAWLVDPFLDSLRDLDLSLALCDFRSPYGEENPSLPQARPFLVDPADFLTGPVALVRLIGDRTAMERLTKRWDRVVADRGDALKEWAGALAKLSSQALSGIYAFVNNHYGGHGPEIARLLSDLLSEEGLHPVRPGPREEQGMLGFG